MNKLFEDFYIYAIQGKEEQDPSSLIIPISTPLRNWSVVTGPIATKEELVEHFGYSESESFYFLFYCCDESFDFEAITLDELADFILPENTLMKFFLVLILVADVNDDELVHYLNNETNNESSEGLELEDNKFLKELAKQVKVKPQDRAQPAMDGTETVNLGTDEEIKEVKIGTTLSPSKREQLIALLKEFFDVFTWS